MTAIDRPLRHGSDQNVGMVSHQARRISADVASLDSWTDALNLSASSDASFQFVSHDENRVDLDLSGSGFTGIRDDVNMDSSRYSVPRIDRSISLKSECDSPNYNVTDSCGPNQHSYGVRVNSNRAKHHHHHSNHSNQVDSWRASGATAWFNNVASPSKVHHYRPHAFSSAGFRDIGQTSRFGIAADSRLGLPHTTIQNTKTSPSVLHSAGTHQNVAVSNTNGESDNLVDQLDRESERIKTKFMSAWNNVKYGWTLKTKTNFKYDSPIFLLGKCYQRRPVEDDSDGTQSARISNIDEFRQDFSSRFWFTYRREFIPLAGIKNITTDCGWGCMLRSGQMMLAQGLIMHFLGRDWRVYHEPKPEEKAYYREIIRWFADHSSDQNPFSIHKLVELGLKHGKQPGDWYGPASVSLILRDALSRAPESMPVLKDVCVYVAQDCTVYKQDIYELCQSRPKSNSQLSSNSDLEEKELGGIDGEWKRSVIILIPMRLGGECLNPIYIPCVKALLTSDHCIGIIGGKPKHSLYFVGWQEDKLINLDPHYCQDVVDTTSQDFPVQSFHCVSPRKLAVSKMDPSCTVGFYIKSRADFQKFVQTAPKLVIAPHQRGHYPLFIFSEGSSSSLSETPYREQGRLRIRHRRVDRDGNVRSPTIDSEDFVIVNYTENAVTDNQ